ncbi:hypothetical protein GOY11_33500 [Pseudomonas aeruginosa]|nr:hypothetical protein [Pseudomonas aeruginosa]
MHEPADKKENSCSLETLESMVHMLELTQQDIDVEVLVPTGLYTLVIVTVNQVNGRCSMCQDVAEQSLS